jgi:hypothetical protein
MIDHNVMRLHIPVHDSLAVTVVERLEQLKDIVPHIQVVELRVEAPEIGVVDVFEDQRRCLRLYSTPQISQNPHFSSLEGIHWCVSYLRIANDVEEGDDVGAAAQVLEDFDLTLDLLLLNGLEDLDDAFLVIDYVDALKDLRVFAAS